MKRVVYSSYAVSGFDDDIFWGYLDTATGAIFDGQNGWHMVSTKQVNAMMPIPKWWPDYQETYNNTSQAAPTLRRFKSWGIE